jgi:hypothetical protein
VLDHPGSDLLAGIVWRVLADEQAQQAPALRHGKAYRENELVAE